MKRGPQGSTQARTLFPYTTVFRSAECCFLVYDVTNPHSFSNLENWKIEFLKQAAPKNPDAFPFIVLGNKADKESEKKVDDEKVKAWCDENKMPFFLTSAKEHNNVMEAFEMSARLSLDSQKLNQPMYNLPQERGKKLLPNIKKKTGC